MAERSYGCEFACGRPYDVILIQVEDGTTQFLCFPDFVRVASEALDAIMNGTSIPEGAQALDGMAYEIAPMTSSKVKKSGHNAPVTADDDDLIEAFDSRVTVDELPPEFR